jgi:hypothetical protein
MSRASKKEMQEKWARSVKRIVGPRKEVRHVGSHPAAAKLTLEIARGIKVPATLIRNVAKSMGLTDKETIDRLVSQSKGPGKRVLKMSGLGRCECFNVIYGPGQPPKRECFWCQQTPPFRCYKSLWC